MICRALAGLALVLAVGACAPAPQPKSPAPPPTAAPGSTHAGAPPAGAPRPPGVAPTRAPAERAAISAEPRLDVGLAWDLDTVVIEPITRLSLTLSSDRGDQPQGESDSPVDIRKVRGTWEVNWSAPGDEAKSTALAPLDTLWIVGAVKQVDSSRVRWNGKMWRGLCKVFVGPRGKLSIALRLPLETYLAGVVPGEIGGLKSDLMQAGRAQAIAARSYTLFYKGRRGDEGFDLYGTVEDQVYGPVETERLLASECVRTTHGWVALYDGQPIRANYCSTCGGITADVWEAWPTDPLGYLESHADHASAHDYCEASPQYRWHEEWTAPEFMANVARYAPQMGVALPAHGAGSLIDVTAASRSRSGRVWQLVIRTTTGEIVVPAYSLRQVLRRGGNAGSILRSNLFKIDVRRDPATRKALAVVANGRGSGHGVGLCQTGAMGMARAGKSAESILQHYYSGIELKRLY